MMLQRNRTLPALASMILLAAPLGCAGHGPLNPKAALHQQRGAALLAADRLDEAEAELLLVLEYNPGNPEGLNGLGLIAYRRGDLQRAATLFRQALARNDDFAEAHNNLGAVLLGWGQPGMAARSFRAALAVDPGYLSARYNLCMALRRLGDREAARAELQKLVALAPELGEARAELARVLLELGRPAEAERQLRRGRNALASPATAE